MRHYGLPISAAAFAVAAAGLIAAGPAAAARAAAYSLVETASPLPISYYADMAVDDAAGHVFVSGGSSGIEVAGLDGRVHTAITGPTGSTGLALSTDGGTLV